MGSVYRIVFVCCVCLIAPLTQAMLPDFTGIVEDQRAAVVKIATVTHAKQSQSPYNQYNAPPEDIPEIFRHFFEYRGQPQQRDSQSLGSGFIISKDGYIVTNNHVIADADEISVRLLDRREYAAQVIGTDKRSDIALLKIDEKNLPAVQFGDSSELQVGEWVLAIGSPFGLDYSVSAGIVSAIGRSIPNGKSGNYVPFIQTDVSINPGNSGGPLFNMDGRVVGVNSQIYTTNGGSVGLSFSIPSALAQDVIEQLKESGQVKRGWLGVGIQNVDKDLADSFGLDKPVGALITFVEDDSPADKAGIVAGDVILKFNGDLVETSEQLPAIVGLVKPTTNVDVEIMRDQRRKTLQVKVGTLDGEDKNSAADPNFSPLDTKLGLSVQPIPSEYSYRWGIDKGVLISNVEPDSPAAKARLRRGDIITQLGNKVVESIEDYTAAVKVMPTGKPVPVRIVRNGRAGFVALNVPDE